MKFESVEYILSAFSKGQFPNGDLPELALSGRSNVGKSSLLNFLVRRKKAAKVSKTPGKTRAINFFDVNNEWRLVDLPGYGYARLSKKEVERWGRLVDSYLRERKTLAGVIQLVDSRHDPMKLDLEMMEWLARTRIPTVIVLTKVDKIGKNRRRRILESFLEKWVTGADWRVVATSAEKREGRPELIEAVEDLLIRYRDRCSDRNLDLSNPPLEERGDRNS